MPEPDDVGIDKQKILKNIANEAGPASAAPAPAPAKAEPAPAPAPVAVPPPAAAPRESIWDHRHSLAMLILCMIGVLWLVVGITGKVPLGLVLGPLFLAAAAFGIIGNLLRGR